MLKFKKIIAILMLVFLIIGNLPLSAFAYITDLNSNAQFGVISGSLGAYGHELHYANYDGTYMVFCCQYGQTSPSGATYTYDSQFRVELNSGAYQRMAEYIYFGYTMKHGSGLPSSEQAKRDACATQQYVWEYVRNNISSAFGAPSRDSWNSSYMSSSIYASWLSETERTYNDYHYGNVSFNNQTLKVDIGESATYHDTNGVLASYESFSKSINGVTFSHTQGSNDLIVTSDVNSNSRSATFRSTDFRLYRLMPNGAAYSEHEMSSYMYFRFTSGSIQDLLFSSYVDPTFFNVSIEVQSGKIEIDKYNTNGDIVPNCEFELYRDSACTQRVASGKSNAQGKILFDKLKPATYYIKETNVVTGYLVDTNVKQVTVTNGNTSIVEFKNEEPKGTIGIIKKDSKTGSKPQGDATLKNAVYKVYANEDIYNVAGTLKYYSKGDLVATRNTKENGVTEDVTDLPLGKYIVKEETPPIGYLIDKSVYEVNLEYEDQYTRVITGSATSTDKVKEMRVHIFKSGIKVNSGLTPGLEGAEFTIKLNSDVQKAYAQGYTYAEIWNGIDENGNKVEVNATRANQAQVIAPTYQSVVTDENGDAYTGLLPYGKYIVKETSTPKDYESATDFTFSITDDESEITDIAKKVKDIVVNNEQLETYIKLVKKDLKTNKNVIWNNATFQIKATKDIYDRATGKILYKKGEAVSQKIGSTTYNSFTTNAQNIIIPDKSFTNDNDELGTVVTPLKLEVGSYEITEIKLPRGFLQLESPVKFDVDGIRDYDLDPDGDFIKEVVVYNEQPTGTLKINKTIALRESIDTSIIDISDLSGIQFRLTAKTNIIDYSDASVIYKMGQEVGTYNLEKDGTLKIAELPMGTYELQEVSVIDGLVLDDTKYEIKFEKKDDTTKVYTETRDISNDTTAVEFSKTDITGDKELKGATLTVTDSEGNIIDKWISGDKKHIIEGLKAGGTYYLKEEIQVDSYVKATDIEFTVDNTNEIQNVTMVDKFVEMSKVDIGGNEIEGAKMQVYDMDGNLVDEWISEKESHKIKNLEEDKSYVLHEEVSIGYFVKATDMEFKVTQDKETQHIEMIDKIVDVTKTDMVNGEEVEGAELIVTDLDGNEIDRWTSGKEAHHVVGLEESKKYILTEITAPYGYEVAESIEFEVTTDKETQIIEMKDMPILKNIKIVKLDSKTKEKIYEKFKFGIYEDEECTKLIEEKESNKNEATVTFEGVRFGTFYIKEINAPKGYQLSDRIVKLEINDKGVFIDGELIEENDEAFSFNFYNDEIPKIQTGNILNNVVLAVVIALSVIGIISSIIILKRKNKKIN